MKKIFFAIMGLFLSVNLTVLSADMRFIQVDEVLFDKNNQNSIQRFETLVDEINKQKKVDFVVFSGNNIAKPNEENLKGFINIANKIKVPYYFVLGNKDVNKQKEFGKVEYFKTLKKSLKWYKKIESPNYVFVKNDIIFIVVDGSKEVIPSTMGYFKKEVLNWLKEQLDLYKDKKVVLLQHFPLIPPSNRESYYTFNAKEYLEILSNYDNIKAIVSGHFGINNEQTVNNVVHVSTAKAPQYRIIDILDYETESPLIWSTIKE